MCIMLIATSIAITIIQDAAAICSETGDNKGKAACHLFLAEALIVVTNSITIDIIIMLIIMFMITTTIVCFIIIIVIITIITEVFENDPRIDVRLIPLYVVFEDVGFESNSLEPLTHISCRCEVPTPSVAEGQPTVIINPPILKHFIQHS